VSSDLEIMQGADLSLLVTYTDDDGEPFDLTGWTARMQVRGSYNDTSAAIDISTTPNDQGRIDIDLPTGTLAVAIVAAATATVTRERNVWDLFVYGPAGQVETLVRGEATLLRRVTR